jgi:hypothetical protein
VISGICGIEGSLEEEVIVEKGAVCERGEIENIRCPSILRPAGWEP